MAKVWKAEDGGALVLNPTLELDVEVRLRRRDRPRARIVIESADELELLRWLLDATRQGVAGTENVAEKGDGEDGDAARLVREATERGLLVPLGAVPRPEPPFRCSPDDATLALLPETGGARVEATNLDLRPNPRAWLQSGAEPPGPTADRARIPEGDDRSFGAFAGERPLWWVEDPRSRLLMPVWLAGELHGAAVSLSEGVDVTELSDTVIGPLHAAGFLIEAVDRAAQRARVAQLSGHLRERGYVHLRDIVPALLLASARRYFRALRREGFFELDTHQVAGMRDGLYCDVVTSFIQAQLAPVLSDITAESLRPSYTWLRRYRPGAVLRRHVDRAQCRWNVSVAIDTEPEIGRNDAWPIWLDVDGEDVPVRLGLGDGIVYRGDEIPHWREALPDGNTATMAFLHYVRDDFSGSLD